MNLLLSLLVLCFAFTIAIPLDQESRVMLRHDNNRYVNDNRFLNWKDKINGENIDEENEIPEDQDPVEDAMENGDGYQGDMDLTEEQAAIIVNGTEEDVISMRAALKEKHWPRRESNIYIPYVISGKYDDNERANIARAFEDFENNTCLRIVPRTNEDDYIDIVRGRSCKSQLGRIGGRQELSLGDRCADSVGTPLHELMHTIGFWHEQMRDDRDNFVQINWKNILPGKESQFTKCTSCDNQGLKYDPGSIMHYHAYAFSKSKRDGLKTIELAKGGSTAIGQRNGLSSLDIIGINKLYCPGYKASCADNDESCPSMVKDCENVEKRNWMVNNCAGTCKICVREKCVNKYDTTIRKPVCPGWKRWCTGAWAAWMKGHCAKTCGYCS